VTVVSLGTLLSLSACGTSGTSAIGTYTAVFNYSQHSTKPTSAALTLKADGHFVLIAGGHALKGTWSESDGSVTFNGTDGPAKFVLHVHQSGNDLGSASRPGSLKGLGAYELKGRSIPWYAVRK
jgi:hypothetical protein